MDSADDSHMRRALELARRGAGRVEPNPQVGAVVVDARGAVAGEGWHEQFGGPHAEVHALARAGSRAAGGTLYVTLEPCCHFGKTPPCTDAIRAAGVARVVTPLVDPFPAVAGRGVSLLRAAGIAVEVGLRAAEAERLIAPFRMLNVAGRPYLHAKWAMTLDGKLAARTGRSHWISGEPARAIVHALRGRMDAILVGAGTVRADDPLLTARPPGPRTPVRVVIDSRASLSLGSQLVKTVADAPVLVVTTAYAPPENRARLQDAGVEVLLCPALGPPYKTSLREPRVDLAALLPLLGQRRWTNVLVEGGSEIFGSLWDLDLLDEFHIFLAPKLLGGGTAPGPLGGDGRPSPSPGPDLADRTLIPCGDDFYIHGYRDRTHRPRAKSHDSPGV